MYVNVQTLFIYDMSIILLVYAFWISLSTDVILK
jgi:hypothetical protein